MARVHHVKHAQQRFETRPVLDDDGNPVIIPVHRRDGEPKLTRSGRQVTRRITENDPDRPKPNYTCGKCGVEIKPGDPYKWVKTKSGPYGGAKKVRCAACPTWKPSELSSSKMATVMAAEEDLSARLDDLCSVDDLEEAAREFAEVVREVAEEYRESATNIVDGFGHETYVSEELEQKADELDGWADDIEMTTFEEADTTCEECDGTGLVETDEGEEVDCDSCDGTGEDESLADEHWETQRDALMEIVGACPV